MPLLSHVLLTVRYSSSRLPGKCLKVLGNLTVIEHVVQRVLSVGLNPIICTSTDPSDDIVRAEAKRLAVKCFSGSLLNKLERWSDCAAEYSLPYVHILDVDDPFFDTDEVKESIDQFLESDLDLLKTSPRSDSGFASVGMTISQRFLDILVLRAQKLKGKDFDVIPWELITETRDKIVIKQDKYLIDSEHVLRLTLDYPEDLELLDNLAAALGPTAGRSEIENYLIENPNLIRINAHRNFDFLSNKKNKLAANFGIAK